MDSNKKKQLWVKKLVRVNEWNNYYKHLTSYCFLEKEVKGIWVGFCCADIGKGRIPRDCELLTNEELRQVDNYRKQYHIEPRPFTDVEIENKESKNFEKSQPQKTEEQQIDVNKVWEENVF